MSAPLSVGIPPRRALVGRASTLQEIRARLVDGSDVALQGGLPGVGKTALAIATAHDPDVRAEFPGGRLWLSVGKEESSGLSHWSNRISVWATKLGVTPQDRSEPERRAVYREYEPLCALVSDLLGERRALLVFDDVWLPEDALLFKDIGSDCQRLLTTRLPDVARAFDPSPTRVSELSTADGSALLRQYAPDAGPVLAGREEKIVRTLGGLPLAIVVAGINVQKVLTDSGHAAAADTVERLLRAPTLLSDLDLRTWLPESQISLLPQTHRTLLAVIGLTTESFTPEQSAALAALATFPPKSNSFSRDAGEYVATDPALVVRLRQSGLLENPDATRDRLAMHQAVNDYARRGGQGDEGAYRRMAEYFIGYLDRLREEPDAEAWLGGLEDEDENIRAAVLWAERAYDSDVALRLLSTLWPYWYKRNRFQQGLDLARLALGIEEPSAPDEAHRLLRAKVLNDAGNLAYNMADMPAAERFHREALGIRTELGETGLMAGSWNNLGIIHRERGELDQAEELFERAREINESPTGRPDWLGINLNNLGLVAERRGDFAAARTLQQSSRDTFEACSEAWGAAMASVDLATALLGLGLVDDAHRLLRDTLTGRRAAGDDKRMAAALRGCAQVALDRGEPALARRRLLASLTLSAPLLDRLGEALAAAGLLTVCGELDDVRLGTAAAGALRAYGTVTGCTVPDWTGSRAAAAGERLRAQSPDRFDDLLEQSYRTAVGAGGIEALRVELPLRPHLAGVDVGTTVDGALAVPAASP